jgi:REP element-mobilizing transposase RayT
MPGTAISSDDRDREIFLRVLGSVVQRYRWLGHAYCLMDHHYHLLIETPEANLSIGMRQLNGVYTQAYHRRHRGLYMTASKAFKRMAPNET